MNDQTGSLAATSLTPRWNALFRWRIFLPAALLLVGALVVVSWQLDRTGFISKLAELLLQLGLIVIVGALIKYVVEDVGNKRVKAEHAYEKRRELLRRMTAAHVTIAHARLLIYAHKSAKTYTEQLRNLMAVRPELEEIAEDLNAAEGLYNDSAKIKKGVNDIVLYLKEGIGEYVRWHSEVDKDAKATNPPISLDATIECCSMDWIKNFKNASGFPKEYDDALTASKGAMREQVFGSSG